MEDMIQRASPWQRVGGPHSSKWGDSTSKGGTAGVWRAAWRKQVRGKWGSAVWRSWKGTCTDSWTETETIWALKGYLWKSTRCGWNPGIVKSVHRGWKQNSSCRFLLRLNTSGLTREMFATSRRKARSLIPSVDTSSDQCCLQKRVISVRGQQDRGLGPFKKQEEYSLSALKIVSVKCEPSIGEEQRHTQLVHKTFKKFGFKNTFHGSLRQGHKRGWAIILSNKTLRQTFHGKKRRRSKLNISQVSWKKTAVPTSKA